MNDYEQYSSSENLKIYYDFKHINLNQHYQYEEGEIVDMVNQDVKYDAKLINCIPKPLNELEQREYLFPPDDNLHLK